MSNKIRTLFSTKKQLLKQIEDLTLQVFALKRHLEESRYTPELVTRLEGALKQAEKQGFYKESDDFFADSPIIDGIGQVRPPFSVGYVAPRDSLFGGKSPESKMEK
jgi:hypothetical protein